LPIRTSSETYHPTSYAVMDPASNQPAAPVDCQPVNPEGTQSDILTTKDNPPGASDKASDHVMDAGPGF
jgi:hypothetical protein